MQCKPLETLAEQIQVPNERTVVIDLPAFTVKILTWQNKPRQIQDLMVNNLLTSCELL